MKIASIDVGSYTARMLVAELKERGFIPIIRTREYINVAEFFENYIKKEGINRTAQVIKRFSEIAEKKGATKIYAVGTGVIRRAKNKDEFISAIKKETGIEIVPISEMQEALLTAEGVMYSLSIKEIPVLITDIGGGSTEFFLKKKDTNLIHSIPIGAALLKKRLETDPPKKEDLDKAFEYIDELIKKRLFSCWVKAAVGTGGTITTLSAVLHKIPFNMISPERLNGKIIRYDELIRLFQKMSKMDTMKIAATFGLDKNRAKVIISGTIILLSIMDFFHLSEIITSLSDILEGIILNPKILKGDI